MAAFNKFNSTVAAFANKVHNLASDQLQIALCATANTPVASNTQLSNLTEIAYTNLSSRVVTTTSSTQSAGLYKLICVDLVLTASGAVAAFQFVVLYNNTATNKELLGWWDYGSAVTMANTDTFTVDFDGTNGVFQIQ
jgi:hypothetical protein